jgi:3-phosphoshikimate 1-carboxyvinyltransferase
MKTLQIKKGSLLTSIKIPPSKSYANRVLILSSLISDSPVINNLPVASDVSNLLRCLKDVGLKLKTLEDEIKFLNSFPQCEKNHEVFLSVGEGGTTARFLSVMLLLGKQKYVLKLGKRLKERPWNDFIHLTRSLGGHAELKDDILTLRGPITFPSSLEVDCSLTTQFASAFQLINFDNKSEIIPTNMKSSQSYWAMTNELQKKMKTVEHYDVPLDWSSASYPMAFAALNHRIVFPKLHYDKFQADSKIYDLLKSFDCISENEEGISVGPLKVHKNVEMDVSDCLDLVPTLSYLLSHIEGKHSLNGISNLIHKESNRLDEVIKLMKIFNRNAYSDGSTLWIEGSKDRVLSEVDLILPDDHRMVMSGTLFLLQHSGGKMTPVDSVNKSFPGFFDIISF